VSAIIGWLRRVTSFTKTQFSSLTRARHLDNLPPRFTRRLADSIRDKKARPPETPALSGILGTEVMLEITIKSDVVEASTLAVLLQYHVF
jgi:hypothetical protein